jgi:hypothetical protein
LNHYTDIDLPVQGRREWAQGSLGGFCMCDRCKREAGEDLDQEIRNGNGDTTGMVMDGNGMVMD